MYGTVRFKKEIASSLSYWRDRSWSRKASVDCTIPSHALCLWWGTGRQQISCALRWHVEWSAAYKTHCPRIKRHGQDSRYCGWMLAFILGAISWRGKRNRACHSWQLQKHQEPPWFGGALGSPAECIHWTGVVFPPLSHVDSAKHPLD